MSKVAKTGKVITGIVRFSFANVFEPRMNDGDSVAKYSVQLLIPKDDVETINKIYAAEAFALQQGMEKNKFSKIPKMYKRPLHDGDEEKDDEMYEGFMYLSAKTTQRPDVVYEDRTPIIDTEDFYSGCWGHASITLYAYKVDGATGVAVALNNIMKTHDGEPLGGKRASAADDFAVLDTEDFD